jgi:hypothetical protein
MILYEHTAPVVALAAGVAVVAVVSLAGYWRFAGRDWITVILAGLRMVFLVLLGWCLLLPGERTVETHQQKSRFIVLVDKSRSMTLAPGKEATNRWEIAGQVLRQPWASDLAAKCDIDCYAFAGEVSGKMSLEEARRLEPEGDSTLLREALKKTAGRYEGIDVAGCLLLSDGLDTREAFTDWSLEKRPFPVFSLPLERDAVWEEEPDVQIDAVSTPRRVTVGWQTELKAVVSGHGTRGQPIPVKLFKDGVLLKESETRIPTGGGSKEVVFTLSHSMEGSSTYRVYLPPRPGETQTNNNESAVSVQVVDVRNRLMYIEGPPRWESKYLSRVLKESAQTSPAIFLRGPQGKFMTFGVSGEESPALTDAQLALFKIVILGNLSGDELGEERAQALVRFVEAGGSLVLLGGSKAWSPEGFPKTALSRILPVKQIAGQSQEGEYPVRLTDAGRAHAAFSGEAAFWGRVPPVLSMFPGAVPTPAARVLVEAGPPDKGQPVILTQDFGQGKVVAILTDSLWKWQLSPEASKTKPYPRFWNQLLSWLSPKESKVGGREWEVLIDREQCFLGEDVEITAKWIGAQRPPTGAVVNAEITMPDKRKLPFAMIGQGDQASGANGPPLFGFTFKGENAGMFTVVAAAETGGKRSESAPVSFTVKPFTPESLPRPADSAVLKAISMNSGGVFFSSAEELDRALAVLQPRKLEQEISLFRSLWQHWVVIGCLLLVLGVEWLARKLRNMP